jgi:hypothetical protein
MTQRYPLVLSGTTVEEQQSGDGLIIIENEGTITSSNIDLSTGNYFPYTVSSSTTFTVSNVPSNGTATSFILDLTNGGSSAITWWTGVTWPNGTAPTLSSSGRDVLGFFTYNGGTTWSGFLLGKAMA